MVQFITLPETTQGRLAREMGLAFSQGLGKNLPQPELQQVGRQQQGALENFRRSLASGDTPADVSMKWAQSMAGIPGSEQLQKSVLPQYQLQAMSNLYAGIQPGQGVMPQTPGPVVSYPQQGQVGIQAGIPAQAPISQLVPPTQVSPGGISAMVAPSGAPSAAPGAGPSPAPLPRAAFDPQIMQLSVMAGRPYEELARTFAGVPQEQIGAELQNIQLAKAQEKAAYAQQKLPKISPDELNDFVRIGTKYQNMNPEDWFKATQRDFTKFQNVKANFDNANIPGILSGIFRGGKYREDTLKRLENLANPLINLGYEDYVRSSLVDHGLSPTEAEMVIKPMDRIGIKNFKELPKSPYAVDPMFPEAFKDFRKPTYDEFQQSNPKVLEQMTEKYANFLAENIKPNVSILGLREKLRREKNVDWRQYQDALNRAIGKGLTLNAEQQGELGELTNAPRDSLQWIFQDWGRWIDYLTGKK